MGDEADKTLGDFRAASNNANRHTVRGMGALDRSMAKDGYTVPMVSAADGELIIGSARHETALDRFSGVDPIVIEHDGTRPIVTVRTDIAFATDERALRIAAADNRIAELNLDFDPSVLAGYAAEGVSFDDMGFRPGELDELFVDELESTSRPPSSLDRATLADVRIANPCASGDVWRLGQHRLACGSCFDAELMSRLMGGGKAWAVLTEPPYNYGMDYAGGLDDSLSAEDFAEFVQKWREVAREHSRVSVITPGLKNLALYCGIFDVHWIAAWVRSNAMTGSSVAALSVWEPVIFEETETTWQPVLIADGKLKRRIKRDVYNFPVMLHSDEAALHPCPKTPGFWQQLIRDYSEPGDVILDLFLGSGTTILEADKVGRICRGVELSEAYCSMTIARWVAETGGKPQLLSRRISE